MGKYCGQCGTSAESEDLFCRICGAEFHALPVAVEPAPQEQASGGNCPYCTGPVTNQDTSCPYCGKALVETIPPVPAPVLETNLPIESIPPAFGATLDEAVSPALALPLESPAEPAAIEPADGVVEKPIESFPVVEKWGNKRIGWIVELYPAQARFICQEMDHSFDIPRETANAKIDFPKGGLFLTEGTQATVAEKIFEFGVNKPRLEKWLPQKTAQDMINDLRGWGIGLIIVGVISIIFSKFLDPVWGGVVIVIGIANLLVRHKAMFIINGLALIFVGGMNIINVLTTRGTNAGFAGFGVIQIIWGIQELGKFKKYR